MGLPPGTMSRPSSFPSTYWPLRLCQRPVSAGLQVYYPNIIISYWISSGLGHFRVLPVLELIFFWKLGHSRIRGRCSQFCSNHLGLIVLMCSGQCKQCPAILIPDNMGIQRSSIRTFSRPPLKRNIFQDLRVIKKLEYRLIFPTYPSSPLSIITIVHHQYCPSSPMSIITIVHHHHCPSSPLSIITVLWSVTITILKSEIICCVMIAILLCIITSKFLSAFMKLFCSLIITITCTQVSSTKAIPSQKSPFWKDTSMFLG